MPCLAKRAPLWCPRGTKIVPLYKRAPFPTFFWKTVPFSLKGHYFSAPLALFLYRKCMGKQCLFGKWHQNSAPKGTILRTTKRCPKGTTLVPLIFLSVVFKTCLGYPLGMLLGGVVSPSKEDTCTWTSAYSHLLEWPYQIATWPSAKCIKSHIFFRLALVQVTHIGSQPSGILHWLPCVQ